MAKHVLTPQEEALENAQAQTENFFEKHSKMVITTIVIVFALAAAIFGYKQVVVEPRMAKAQEMLYMAQFNFEQQNSDFSLALNGDENTPGFAEVAEKYGNTPAGNLANLYAAACALRLGDMAQAEKFIGNYSDVKGSTGEIINAMAAGIKGEIAVENGDYAKAASLFEKAANQSDNNFTTPMYLRKAALAYRELGQEEKANECLKNIKENYPSSYDARDAEKLLAE